MLSLWIGLTDIYNLFHARDLSPALVAKVSKKNADEAERGCNGILEMRRLHMALDTAVRDGYGWQDLALGHDFYEMETLPEKDRVRYTISPVARKEILKRLLALNHTRAAEEALKVSAEKPAKKVRAKKQIVQQAGTPEAAIDIPKEFRLTLPSDVYAYRVIQQLLRTSGGEAPIRQIARAYAVLSDHSLVKEIAESKGMHSVAKEWMGAASQQVEFARFMPMVKELVDREFVQWHGDGLEGTLKLTSDAKTVENDVWVVADAEFALSLIRDLPSSLVSNKTFIGIERMVLQVA